MIHRYQTMSAFRAAWSNPETRPSPDESGSVQVNIEGRGIYSINTVNHGLTRLDAPAIVEHALAGLTTGDLPRITWRVIQRIVFPQNRTPATSADFILRPYPEDAETCSNSIAECDEDEDVGEMFDFDDSDSDSDSDSEIKSTHAVESCKEITEVG